MKSYRNHKTEQLGDALNTRLEDQLSAEEMTDEERFSFAGFDASAAERGGYSNYSYWGATVRAFLKNKVAVFFLLIMVATLAFTFLQPYLPNQRDPLVINYNESGRTLSNLSPGEEVPHLVGHPDQPVHRLHRGLRGGRAGHPHGGAVGLCAAAGLLLYRALQHL